MTLTQAAFWTRRFGVVVAAAFVLFLVITIIILNLPGRDPLPLYLTADFRCTDTADQFLLSKISIPTLQVAAGSEGLIEIDTPTGTVERLPLIANVYEYSDRGPSLSAQNDARRIADALGFDPALIQRESAARYSWAEDQFGRSLTVDGNSRNFDLRINYRNPIALPDEGKLPSDTEARSLATAFLRSKGWLLEDYAIEAPITTNINVLPDGTFSQARSRAEAELIRVDFVRSKAFLSVDTTIPEAEVIKSALEEEYFDYETNTRQERTEDGALDYYDFETQIVNIDTQKSIVAVYVGPKDERKQDTFGNTNIYDIEYHSWALNTQPCGTYPLRSATAITDTILNGEASLVYLNPTNGDTVVPYTPRNVRQFSIKQVRIVYLDTKEKQQFLQPVYLITGEALLGSGGTATFFYYTPAIDYNNLQDPLPVEAAVVVE